MSNRRYVPVAMISHYEDDACSTLATGGSFHGLHRNPNADVGSPEANFTYFCDPDRLDAGSHYARFGIHHLEMCYVDNGGNWYHQPLHLCAAFESGGSPLYVKFWTIDLDARTTSHQQYLDADCTRPLSENKTVDNNVCMPSTVPGVRSYQILVPDAMALAGDEAQTSTSPHTTAGVLFFSMLGWTALGLGVGLAYFSRRHVGNGNEDTKPLEAVMIP